MGGVSDVDELWDPDSYLAWYKMLWMPCAISFNLFYTFRNAKTHLFGDASIETASRFCFLSLFLPGDDWVAYGSMIVPLLEVCYFLYLFLRVGMEICRATVCRKTCNKRK